MTRLIRAWGVALLVSALLAAACAAPRDTVVIGSADFTEQLILGHMYALALEEAGIPTEARLNLGSREVIFPALENGELDVLPEYLGALHGYLAAGQDEAGEQAEPEVLTEVGELRMAVSELLPESLVLLESSEAQDQDALAVTQETAREFNLETVSDLAPVAGQLVAGGPPEERTRPVGLPGLKRVYGIEFKEFRPLDTGPLTLEALRTGQIDVGRVFTTQGTIAAENLVVLKEDKPLIPGENITLIVREEVLTPEMEEALNAVSKALQTDELTALNRRVDIDKDDPEVVARDFLVSEGLISG